MNILSEEILEEINNFNNSHDLITEKPIVWTSQLQSQFNKQIEQEFIDETIDAGLKEADVVIEKSYKTEQTHQGYIEPHACLANVGPDGSGELWVTTQGHFHYRNTCAKLLGMNIFQTAIILFFVSLGSKKGGAIPIIIGDYGHGHPVDFVIKAANYDNPLPHVLMLTAIVVGIATTALALALVARIHEAYNTIEEDEIHRQEVEP